MYVQHIFASNSMSPKMSILLNTHYSLHHLDQNGSLTLIIKNIHEIRNASAEVQPDFEYEW